MITSCKLVLLGDSSVGKSSIVNRFVSEEFSIFQESTIGASFLTKDIVNNKNETIRLEIWDTAGQERYRSLAPMYYRCAKIALVIYDVNIPESFDGAKKWISELNEKTEKCNIYLIGNKIDVNSSFQESIKRKVNNYVKETGIKNFYLSAKSGENLKESFDFVINNIDENSTYERKILPLKQDSTSYSYYCCN